MKARAFVPLLVLLGGWLWPGAPAVSLTTLLSPARALAQEAWETEFREVCSRTDDAMSISPDDLRGLLSRCDALKPQVERTPEPGRKVFLRRLQMCRDLYAFTLEAKEKR